MNIDPERSTERRAYRSPARAARKAETRQRILGALADRMAHESFDSLSMDEIAGAARVAPATLYRYFPNRNALLDGLSGDYFNRRFGDLPFPRTADEIAPVMVQSFTAFDLDPDFVRAFFVTNLGRTARSRGRRRRIEAIQAALKPLTADMEEERRRTVEAVIAYLAGIQSWLTMQEEFGLSGAQVGRAVSWAITTLLKDLEAQVGSERKGEDGGNSS